MSAPTIYDLTSPEIQLFRDIVDAWNQGTIPTLAQVSQAVIAQNGQFRSIPFVQSVQIASGVVTVQRLSLVNYIEIDTEGAGIPTDDCDTLAFTGTGNFLAGDKYIFFIKNNGRRVNFTTAGNFRPKGTSFELQDLDAVVEFTVSPSLLLVETGRYPQTTTDDEGWDVQNAQISGDALTAFSRIVSATYVSGETLAQGSTTQDPSSAWPGTITAWVDEGSGSGPFIIGQYTTLPTDTPQDISDGLAANINLGFGYTALSSAGAVCTVTAPIGTGSTANSYNFYTTITGSVLAVDIAMGTVTAGVDGSEAATNLDTITGLNDGPFYVSNGMASADITIIAGGNIVGGALPITLTAGSYVQLLKIGSTIHTPL